MLKFYLTCYEPNYPVFFILHTCEEQLLESVKFVIRQISRLRVLGFQGSIFSSPENQPLGPIFRTPPGINLIVHHKYQLSKHYLSGCSRRTCPVSSTKQNAVMRHVDVTVHHAYNATQNIKVTLTPGKIQECLPQTTPSVNRHTKYSSKVVCNKGVCGEVLLDKGCEK